MFKINKEINVIKENILQRNKNLNFFWKQDLHNSPDNFIVNIKVPGIFYTFV